MVLHMLDGIYGLTSGLAHLMLREKMLRIYIQYIILSYNYMYRYMGIKQNVILSLVPSSSQKITNSFSGERWSMNIMSPCAPIVKKAV